MVTRKSYRWRPAPWRVGQKGLPQSQAIPASSLPEEGGKKTGTIVLVLVGAATVAFGVMELLGITKVFAPAPAALPPIAPGAAPAPGATAPATAPAAGGK